MASARRKVFVGSAVVLGATLLAALALALGGSSPARLPLPIPNGYDDFVKANEATVGNVGNFPNLGREELVSLVSTNAEALRLMRVGLSRQCVWPLGPALNDMSGTVSQLGGMKKVAQLLAAEGKLREMEGRPGHAARSYTDAIRFGNEISRGGLLITRLVGIACEAIGGSALAKVIPRVNNDEARQILTELEKVESSRVPWAEVMKNERACARHELMTHFHPVLWVASIWKNRQAIQKSEMKHKLVIAHERLLATELALRVYQAEHGGAAPRLDDLVTNLLAQVPQDSFTGRPLVYRPQGTNWLVYSVGSDGVDDGGRAAGRGLPARGDILFNSTW